MSVYGAQRNPPDLSPAPRSYQLRQLASNAVPEEGDDEGLRIYMTDRLQAPIELTPGHPQDALDNQWLTFVVDNYEVDLEAKAFLRDDDDYSISIDQSYRMLREFGLIDREQALNCATWYETARRQFIDEVVGPCLLAPMVTETERIKHHPRAGDKKSADLSRRSEADAESLFEFGIGTEALSLLTRSVEQVVLDQLIGVPHLRAFVECMCTIGYTNGKATSVVAIEWSASGVHCYPDTVEAFKSKNGNEALSVFDDCLQGYAKPRR